MYNKKSLLITSLIIMITVMVSINSITAADNNETTDNDNIKKTNITTQINTYSQLKTEVDNAKRSNTDEYIINLEKNNYTLDKSLTWKSARGQTRTLIINGNDSIIQGNNETRFIEVGSGYTLKIYNLTIENTKQNVGSAIYNSGNTTLENITISKNTITSKVYGGTIMNLGGNLTIKNSYIINNTSPNSTGGISTTNNGITIIENCTFTDNNAENALIYNFINSTTIINNSKFINNTSNSTTILINDPKAIKTLMINSTISQNKANNLIYNYKELELVNTTIENNTANNIIYNQENTITLNKSHISNNTAEYILKIDLGELNITESFLTKNNVTKHVIYQNESSINVLNSEFINNSAKELFYSENETFNTVINNKYAGNSLGKTNIIAFNKTYNFDEEKVVNGTITTNKIYNTTVNTGIIEIYENDTLINTTAVHNGKFQFTDLNSQNHDLLLKFIGEPDYINDDTSVNIKIVSPAYSLNITVDNDNVNYKDYLEYTLSIINIGEGNGSNITLYNITPTELIYLSSNDNNYNYSLNQWYIHNLTSNQSKTLKIKTQVNSTEDFNITIKTPEINLNKNITIKKPYYQLELISDKENYLYASIASYNLTIKNIGKGTGYNLKISISSDNKYGINKVNLENLEKIESNENITITFTKPVLKTGDITTKINIIDIFNITSETSKQTYVKTPSIQVEPIITKVGSTIDLKANISDIHKYNNGKIIFKINGLTIENHKIEVNSNSIKLLNYTINPNWKARNYTLQVKYMEKGFENVIQNTATLTIEKLNTYSIFKNITTHFNQYINITAYLYDENNNTVNSGKVIFKVNGISIKENITIKEGFVKLKNYYISIDKFSRTNYTLELVYSGNSLYNTIRNYSMLNLIKFDTQINITNTTNKKGENYTITGEIKNNYNETVKKGYIVIKINGISFEKRNVKNNTFIYSLISPTNKIYNITVSFSGNNYMYPTIKTIEFFNRSSLNQENKKVLNKN